MLKKTKTAVLTAIATMLSTVSPLATFAETPEHEQVQTIPDRIITQELHTCVDVPAVLDGEMMPVSTTATIPERVYTCTTVSAIEIQPEEFPLERNYDVTVNVVDSKTSEHVDGVKVHFVETQSLTSNVITRDYGTWNTSESENYSINIIHSFDNLSSTIALTAVLEDIPEGYSYLGGATNVTDFIIDNAMDWYYAGYYGYENQPHTNFTIYLDKEYKGSFQASCLLIDGNTGEYVEGAEVSLSEWDENGNLGNCIEWVTSGKQDDIDFDFTLPDDSHTSLIQFVADKLPEKYSKYTYCPFVESYAGAETTEQSFILYVYEDGYDPYDNPSIITDTHTIPPITTTTTTVTTMTSVDYPATTTALRQCEICGTYISESDGVITPLGLFICSDCKSAGAGGTRPPFITETVTATTIATTITANTTTSVDYQVTTTTLRQCEICGTYISEPDGVITPLGLFVCSDCKSAGAGGTRPQFPTDSEINTEGVRLVYGDANCDDKVSISDSVLIMQALSNPDEFSLSEQAQLNADVYNRGDGITTQDALTIQMIDINLISVEDLPISAE